MIQPLPHGTERSLPWTVRYALAAYGHGQPLPSWLLMSVQMVLNGHGCASCGIGSDRG